MKTTRRNFARLIAAAGSLIAVDARAADPPPTAQAELVRAEFGQHLTNDELERIRNDFADSAPFLKTFREVKLANGDEPDFTFSALAKR
jgi:hypothetical protein